MNAWSSNTRETRGGERREKDRQDACESMIFQSKISLEECILAQQDLVDVYARLSERGDVASHNKYMGGMAKTNHGRTSAAGCACAW